MGIQWGGWRCRREERRRMAGGDCGREEMRRLIYF
jgi:hypothetical protein